MKTALSLALSLTILSGAAAQTPAPPAAQTSRPEDAAQDRGWPRQFETAEYEITVHQPQVDEWPDFARITFRAALSVAKKGEDQRAYGMIRVSAATRVSVADRLVLLTDRKLEQVTFPNVEAAEAERLKTAVMAAMPAANPMTISLDRVISQVDVSQIKVRQVDVNLAPPKILASDKPAVLVIFLGKARFKPVPGGSGADLMFAINTNWNLFLDPAATQYYLLDGKSWLVTGDLDQGPWAPATSLPAALSRLPVEPSWNDVWAAMPLTPATTVPIVYVSHEPAELVVTKGAPEFEPIPGTKLMLVPNTESDLFYDATEKQYYLLAAGRWFKAGALAGPWTAASASLPGDFQKIPEDANTADVLASIPGTKAANEALILASIPEKATVNRSEVKVNPTYDGEPRWKTIAPTAVQYAYKSPFDVFQVQGGYYCCYNAVWFVAPTPAGVWTVADAVPAAIYSIPPTSPMYNVTYVNIYEATPTTVVTGYTSGYSGATVAATGVVMFGLGLWVGAALDDDDCCWSYHYPPCAFSYGCGAYYHGAYGGYVAGGAVYGPYGGAGGYAAYNPATGVYSRGAYAYGPHGAAGYRAAYNPATGTAAYRAGGSNAYGSWGRGAVTNGDEWVRGGYKSNANGTVGAVQGSGGGAAVHAQSGYGNGATVAKSPDGDVYAGKDGNVYKKTSDGWEQATAQSRSAPRPAPGSTPPPAPRSTATPAAAGAAASGYRAAPQQAGNLDSESVARDRGDWSASRTQQFSGSGGGGGRYAPTGGGWARGGRRR